MNANRPMPDDALPPDLAAITDALDTLAARERGATPRGLAARVHAATLPSLRSPADVVYTFPTAHPRVAPKRGAGFGLALAACLSLLATVGAVWLSSVRTQAVPTSIASADAELEAWFALADLSQETDAFDQLEADAEAVARAVSGSWMPEDLFNADPTSEDSL